MYEPETDWPQPFTPTKDDQYNWICSDGIKWYDESSAIKHQVQLEYDIWHELQLDFITELFGDTINPNMKLNIAFTTVLCLAALKAKDIFLAKEIAVPTAHDENILIALQKITNLACYIYDTPKDFNGEQE